MWHECKLYGKEGKIKGRAETVNRVKEVKRRKSNVLMLGRGEERQEEQVLREKQCEGKAGWRFED